MNWPDRRAEPRWLCSELIRVRLDGGDGEEMGANLEDVSPSGACVQTEAPLAEGARVLLVCRQIQFRGQVRYSVYNRIGWFAGVRFEGGGKWSRQVFTPEHLLDPATVSSRK
jgi:hypothetical protein